MCSRGQHLVLPLHPGIPGAVGDVVVGRVGQRDAAGGDHAQP